jgi:hypothetical protein
MLESQTGRHAIIDWTDRMGNGSLSSPTAEGELRDADSDADRA